MTKTFCPLPWKEIATTPSGTVRLCCSSVSSLSHSRHRDGSMAKVLPSLERSWNTDFFKETRQKMILGESVPACQNCYRQEKAGLRSPRVEWNEKHPHLFSDTLPVEVPLSEVEQLDLRLGHRCNLKCRMCNPYSSSSWAEDWKQMGSVVTPLNSEEWDRLQKNNWPENPLVWQQIAPLIPHLKRVYLTGGEPLLVSFNKFFLKECVRLDEAKHIELRYNTNGTLWDAELEDLWGQFQKVHLKISIDGLKDLNNYIRFPSQWVKIENNLDRALSLSKSLPLEVSVACSVQAYNVFQIPEFLQFFREKNVPVFLDTVHQPSFLSVAVLSPLQSEEVRKKLRGEEAHPGVAGLIELLDSSKHEEWSQFRDYTQKLDALRGQNVSQFVPELRF